MDFRRIEQIERDDPSEETQQLTNRWKEFVEAGEYRTSNGVWKQYNPPRQYRAEIKRNERILNQKRKRLLWVHLEEQNGEPEDDSLRRKELHRLIENKLENATKATWGTTGPKRRHNRGRGLNDTLETESTISIESFGVPAMKFKRYLRATGVRYIQMGYTSHVHNDNNWDLEETIRQAEQKLKTNLKTIDTQTTNDERLLETLMCQERKTLEQITDEYKPYQKHLSTRFGVVFYDDRIIIQKAQRTTIIMLLQKGHAAINKMRAPVKSFLWSRITRDIQQKCNECVPCKMAGKNIKPQLTMTEINYLPTIKKTNQEIQLDFIGPIRFKHRRYYILLSLDRYSRWHAACICEAPAEKTANTFFGKLSYIKWPTTNH